MKMTPFIKDSRESNSNLEEHKDNLENHDVYEGKRFQISSNILPPRSTKRRRKFKSSLEGQPPISTYFKPKQVFSFSSSPDQT